MLDRIWTAVTRHPFRDAVRAGTIADSAFDPWLGQDALFVGDSLTFQARLQEVESMLEPIPFDTRAARSYGLVVAAVVGEGRKPRSRFDDLLIAATAHAHGLDLYSRNAADFIGLENLIRVVAV